MIQLFLTHGLEFETYPKTRAFLIHPNHGKKRCAPKAVQGRKLLYMKWAGRNSRPSFIQYLSGFTGEGCFPLPFSRTKLGVDF